MEFKYFKGPVDEMSDLLVEKAVCAICGMEDYCFELDYSITEYFSDEEKEGKIGCINCLKKGIFEFWHDTEFGILVENGISNPYPQKNLNLSIIPKASLTELRRTPK